MMKDFFVRQFWSHGLGNFINCTPAIITLNRVMGEKIPVLFDTDFVRDLYKKWDYISVLNSFPSDRKCLFDSRLTNMNIPDYRFIHNQVCKKSGIKSCPVPHTYVPYFPCPEEYKKGRYVVIARGCAENSIFEKHKECGDAVYNMIMSELNKREIRTVLIGTDSDMKRNMEEMTKWFPCDVELNDIHKSAALVGNCAGMISNDTGMYHAGGALNIPVFVMWKNTPFVKNKSPSDKVTYSYKGNWERDFRDWIEKLKV